ncbi:MAG: hypothetical protein ABI874_10735, partial [Chloroflexota bacterium]
RDEKRVAGEGVVLNATDPANIFGGELPDVSLRFARVPSTHVVLSRGQPVLVAADTGKRIVTASDADASIIEAALRAYVARPNAPRHVIVNEWNDTAVRGSADEAMLQSLGFSRTPSGMEKWM